MNPIHYMLNLKFTHKFALKKKNLVTSTDTCTVTCTEKTNGTHWTQHSSWGKLGVEQPFLAVLVRVEGITHSWMQKWLRCFHTFIFSKVSSEGIDLATYLSFLFNENWIFFFCTLLVFPQSRGPLAPGSTSPKGCDLILGCQRSLYTSLSCCYVVGGGFFPPVSFYLFFTGEKKKGSRVFLTLRHVIWDKRPQLLHSSLPTLPAEVLFFTGWIADIRTYAS